MSQNLRNDLIRLAYNNPELRSELLPLLKTAGFDSIKFRFSTKYFTLSQLKQEVGHIPHVHFDVRQASDLIESLLLEAPVNPFILRMANDGSLTLLDGAWRLSVIDAFWKGEFALTNLDYFPELEGKTISEIPGMLRRRVDGTQLLTYVLEPGMTDEMVAKFVRQRGHPR